MSAFVVSDRTMQVCVTALHNRQLACEDADKLGRDLFALNERAVNWRYDGVDKPDSPSGWEWKVTCPLVHGDGIPVDRKLACEWLKALHCLRYQLTEGEQFIEHDLYKRIEKRAHQIESYLAQSLPEYQNAPWDF